MAAQPPPSAPSAVVPVDHEAVEAARPALTELILTLRSSEPVEARGMALGWRLLTDPLSPIYAPPSRCPRDSYRLWHEALAVVLALQSIDVALDVTVAIDR